MVIIIFRVVDMKLLDIVREKHFLSKLFPTGLTGEVYLGQLSQDVTGRISITIHTKQKPAIEIEKWGVWGKRYNVIAIELMGTGCGDVAIKNWTNVNYSLVDVKEENNRKVLRQEGSDWSISLEFEDFMLQGCSTYLV